MKTPKADAVRENALLDLQEQIENECFYTDVVKVWNEYLEENLYEDKFYPMQDFETVCGDSFKELYPKIVFDFSFDADGFWIQNEKIHSGSHSASKFLDGRFSKEGNSIKR